MIVLKSSYQHLSLYLHEDSLFVYSLVTFNLYAFKGESAALFLILENNIEEENSKNKKAIKLMKQILNAEDKCFQEVITIENSKIPLEKYTKQKIYTFYRLNDFIFYFDIQDKKIVEKFEKLFKHLKHIPLIGENINKIAIKIDNGVYKVYIQNKFIKEISSQYQIVPIVLGIVRFMYYSQVSFLVALHAASLNYRDRVLIMPGVSGSGKSTLSAYLTTCGFTLYSDELSVITIDEMMLPIPLGIGAKESSWEVLSEFIPDIAALEVYKRYDNQNIKYPLLDNYAYSKASVKNAIILYSKYKKGAKSKLESIDMIEGLSTIMNSQYHLYNPKDVTIVEQWLKLLATCDIYKFEYSNLYEAEKIIKKLMQDE